MAEILRRRDFLGGAAALAGGAVLAGCGSGPEAPTPISTPDTLVPDLEWEQRKQFLLEMKKYQDSLPTPSYRTSTEWIIQRTHQLTPYFQSQNIIKQPVPFQHFQPLKMPGQREQDEVSATASCSTGTLYFNQRLNDPTSDWSKAVSGTLALLAHEQYHSHSMCAEYTSDNVEASAQVVSLSVLAAITNDPQADKDLALEAKRGVAEALVKWDNEYLFYEALKDTSKREDYAQFAASTFGGKSDDIKQIFADYDKPEYAQYKQDKEAALYRYSVLPYQLFTLGVSRGYLFEGEVLLPSNYSLDTLKNHLQPNDTSIPLPTPNPEEASSKIRLNFDVFANVLREAHSKSSQQRAPQTIIGRSWLQRRQVSITM